MKTILILALLSLAGLSYSQKATTQQAPPQRVEVTIQAEQDSIPDTLWVVIDGEQVGIPTGDTKAATQVVKEIVEENKGSLPKNAAGWIMLIVGILFSARGTVLITAGKGIYNFLKIFLKKTLNIVAFIAGLLSAGITLILGNGEFEYRTFATLWGIISFLAVYVYEVIKKKPATAKA